MHYGSLPCYGFSDVVVRFFPSWIIRELRLRGVLGHLKRGVKKTSGRRYNITKATMRYTIYVNKLQTYF